MNKALFQKAALAGVILLAGVFISVVGAFGEQSKTSPEEKKAAKAFFPEKNYVFDDIVEGKEVSHEFVVYNKGEAELEIINVKTG